MTAFAWSALGLLTAALLGAFGAFYFLGTRIDTLGAALNARIDSLSTRIASLSTRIDSQSARIDTHLERHTGWRVSR